MIARFLVLLPLLVFVLTASVARAESSPTTAGAAASSSGIFPSLPMTLPPGAGPFLASVTPTLVGVSQNFATAVEELRQNTILSLVKMGAHPGTSSSVSTTKVDTLNPWQGFLDLLLSIAESPMLFYALLAVLALLVLIVIHAAL